MSRFELTQIRVKPGSYEKPERSNKNIPDKKYNKVDKTCQEEVFLSNDGNVYVPQHSMNAIFNTTKKRGQFIYDNKLDDDDKKIINGVNAIKSSGVVGFLDKRSHETRDAESIQKIRDAFSDLKEYNEIAAKIRKKKLE